MNAHYDSIARAGGLDLTPDVRRPHQRRPDTGNGTVAVSSDGAAALAYRAVVAIESLARRVAGGLRTRRRRRTALAELRSLDDRTLKDIGLPRGEIAATVEALLTGTPDPRTEPLRAAAPAPVTPLPVPARPAALTPYDRAA